MDPADRPGWLTSHETVTYEAFKSLEMRFELMENKINQQEIQIGSLKSVIDVWKATKPSDGSHRDINGANDLFPSSITREASRKRRHGIEDEQSILEPSQASKQKKDNAKIADSVDDDEIQFIKSQPISTRGPSTTFPAIVDSPSCTSKHQTPVHGAIVPHLQHMRVPGTPQHHKYEPCKIEAGRHLRFIQDLDFKSYNIMIVPSFAIEKSDIPIFEEIELDSSNEPKITHHYIVALGETGAHLGTGYRLPVWPHGRYRGIHINLTRKEAFEGTVLEIKANVKETSGHNNSSGSLRQKTDRAKSQRVDKPVLPRYIYELGELFMKSVDRKTGEEPPRSTWCHVVVDVCSKEKSLWLVYRYKGVNEDGQVVDRQREFDRDEDMFSFVTGGKGFDMCQVAESMKDWLKQDGSFQPVRNAQWLINYTRCRADPEIVVPIYEEFLEAFKEAHAPA